MCVVKDFRASRYSCVLIGALGAVAVSVPAEIEFVAGSITPTQISSEEIEIAQSWRGKRIKQKFQRAAKKRAKKKPNVRRDFKKAAEGDDGDGNGDGGNPPPNRTLEPPKPKF